MSSEKSFSQDLERSITPSRGTENQIDTETMDDYLRFPDPRKFLVGFICGMVIAPKAQLPQSLISE